MREVAAVSRVREIKIGTVYRHFKGNQYRVIALAKHTETEELCVVYEALYAGGGIWVRPYDMFNSEVDREKYPDVKQRYRFEEVKPEGRE